MTRFKEAIQSPSDMAVCIAFCIAAYLEGAGFHDFADKDELIQFMIETSVDVEEWLTEESEDME